ncbi:hypothetical protein GM1_030_00730 [Gordonia malaquae NBRC 108250]|uniref:Uncharacterized protein n=1 Tax=Gordonia malaquae NBRC 108250 TaxID=1223542 RepID=M3VGW2_GORML|nr:hypothetical protein GM1_030_00730 [Gordonia malaquae NBRC 108250]
MRPRNVHPEGSIQPPDDRLSGPRAPAPRLMTSLTAWIADQIAEAARPIAHRLTADTLSRLRIHITVRLSLEEP